jgi:hypothetical protein
VFTTATRKFLSNNIVVTNYSEDIEMERKQREREEGNLWGENEKEKLSSVPKFSSSSNKCVVSEQAHERSERGSEEERNVE